jgi:hypothetical protein
MKQTLAILTTAIAFSSMANAATIPSYIGNFNKKPNQVLKTKSRSWSDPAFGEQGWTHNSGWGRIWAKAGQVVTIRAVSANQNLHPAISVWFRGADDTAPDKYVTDHFYSADASQMELGAKDETTNALVGNIIMKLVKFGFDKDQNSLVFKGKGIKDGVSGRLVFRFTAAKTGAYMFALGGFSPDHSSLDSALMYDVQTSVRIVTPAAKPPMK